MVSSKISLSAGSLMLALLSSPVLATSYSLVESWQGKNFLDYFNFHVGSDPTNGFVNYLDKETAESTGLVKLTDSGSVYLGVDHVTKLDPHGKKGRDSVRIGSKKYYDKSLVIADIAHMPGGDCGTWPAFWSVGKEWPQDGEIDIIEGVNLQDHNEIVMHTAGTCSMTDTDMTGIVNATGCGADLGTVGCVIEGHKGSFGKSFNSQKGGVYALEWTNDFLKIWFFPRSSIPPSITSGKPDVTQFGTPMALVQESCDIDEAFKPQSFVFDVTFCGDWAGGVYGDSGCPMTDGDSFQSCHNYVANNPTQYKQTYWEINSVKIYQTGVKGVASISSSEPQPPTTAAAPVVSHAPAETEASVKTHTQTQGVNTASVEKSAPAHDDSTAGKVQELNPTTAPAPATTAESPATETIEHSPASKKTRTVTALVTATKIVCPENEQSTAIAPHSSAKPTGASPGVHTAQVPADSQDKQTHTPPAPVESSVPTADVTRKASAVVEEFGSSWIPHSALPSAVVSSVPYDASRASKALIPKPTGVSPESASSGTSGVFVPNPTQTGAIPVFTGAAGRLSVSVSALVFGLLVAFLA